MIHRIFVGSLMLRNHATSVVFHARVREEATLEHGRKETSLVKSLGEVILLKRLLGFSRLVKICRKLTDLIKTYQNIVLLICNMVWTKHIYPCTQYCDWWYYMFNRYRIPRYSCKYRHIYAYFTNGSSTGFNGKVQSNTQEPLPSDKDIFQAADRCIWVRAFSRPHGDRLLY